MNRRNTALNLVMALTLGMLGFSRAQAAPPAFVPPKVSTDLLTYEKDILCRSLLRNHKAHFDSTFKVPQCRVTAQFIKTEREDDVGYSITLASRKQRGTVISCKGHIVEDEDDAKTGVAELVCQTLEQKPRMGTSN